MGCLKLSYHNKDKASEIFFWTTSAEDALKNDVFLKKKVEIGYHLGNVRAVVSDIKHSTLTAGVPGDFEPDILTTKNIYPGGLEQPNRHFGSPNSRYSFNGKEDDKEWGNGIQDYGARMYSKHLNRFFTPDPLTKKYPRNSPYVFANNNPISLIDFVGENGDLPKSQKGFNGKEKVKINHVSSQEVLGQLLKYFIHLRDNGIAVGDVREAFDFNYYVKKGSVEQYWDKKVNDDNSTYKIENAYNATGQGIKSFKANAQLGDGNSTKVTAIIVAAFNNSFRNDHNSKFAFSNEGQWVSQERFSLNSGTKSEFFQIKFNEVTKSGEVREERFSLILNFKTLQDRSSFSKAFIESFGIKSEPAKNEDKTINFDLNGISE